MVMTEPLAAAKTPSNDRVYWPARSRITNLTALSLVGSERVRAAWWFAKGDRYRRQARAKSLTERGNGLVPRDLPNIYRDSGKQGGTAVISGESKIAAELWKHALTWG